MFALCFKSLQVDGSFGVTAAVTEMLMQSHDGFIKLLPALPDEWSEGAFKGLCARGGFELDFAWKNKTLTKLNILSKAGEVCRIEFKPGIKISSNGKKVTFKKLPDNKIEFATTKGNVYLAEYL
jgi:alpha-L-fucosidase 2